MRNRARLGDANAICDRSGFKVKKSELRREWNGLYVRKDMWEPRQPQDFVKGRPDKQSIDNPRPEQADTFLSAGDVTIEDL